MKKISIIIPVYNAQNYLEECIKSIIVSNKDFELILVDDGSTDKSKYICDDYTKKDNRIKTYHKKNGGVSSARNYGIAKATGDYIMFVDADDKLSNNWDNVFSSTNNKDVYFYSTLIDTKINRNDLLKYIMGTNSEKIYLSGIYSKLYRRMFVVENSIYFNEELINGEDMLFNVETAIIAKDVEIINFHFYCYRQSIGQATRKFDNRIINSDLRFHQSLSNLFTNNKIDNSLANEIKEWSLENAVLLILSRISYLKSFREAKKFFDFLNENPYYSVINKKTTKTNKSFIFFLCRFKKYRLIYYYFKMKNRMAFVIKYRTKGQFVKK